MNNSAEISKPQITYSSIPQKKDSLPKEDNKIIKLETNLFEITNLKTDYKLCIYDVSLEPEIDKDNSSLYIKIQKLIESELNDIFIRKLFSGYNLFGSCNNPQLNIEIKTLVDNIEYSVTFKLVGGKDLKEINNIKNFEGKNQEIKAFIERVIKEILHKNKGVIKFFRDLMKISQNNVIDFELNKGTLYKLYRTSSQITENGFYSLLNIFYRYVPNITVYEKIQQLRKNNKHMQESEIRALINNHFKKNPTCRTIYGNFRIYHLNYINFDMSPTTTCFNIKDGDRMKTITIAEYYKVQYKIKIKDLNQPLIVVESKNKNQKNNLNKSQNDKEEEHNTIYLVPELVYIMGNPDDKETNNKREIIKRTRMNPNEKMKEILAIKDMFNSTTKKTYINNQGKEVSLKSPAEVSKEWGITIGDNLIVEGKILTQPNLLFKDGKIVVPNNGRFQSGNIYKPEILDENNFIYIYDSSDTSNIRNLLRIFIEKSIIKGIIKDKNININNLHGLVLNNYKTWDDLKRNLIPLNGKAKQIKMAIVFLSSKLEKFYSQLKELFTNEFNFASQFVISRKLQEPKKAGNIMFNIVEQINIKIGGSNFYIDFFKENILSPDKIYMIIGLETHESNNGIDYVMTSSTSKCLEKTITSICTIKNNLEEKKKALENLINLSLKALQKARSPHPPDCVIIYRQGGNYIQNKKLEAQEVPIFTNILSNKFKNFKPKISYICCNLKSEFKFFEKNDADYINPKSGTLVDSGVIQKNSNEFFLQHQLVIQGTATLTHYQVLYNGIDQKDLSMENLKRLSFDLSYYYWTWSGAIRVPGVLKLASTAMNFYTKHLGGKLNKKDKQFECPEYI